MILKGLSSKLGDFSQMKVIEVTKLKELDPLFVPLDWLYCHLCFIWRADVDLTVHDDPSIFSCGSINATCSIGRSAHETKATTTEMETYKVSQCVVGPSIIYYYFPCPSQATKPTSQRLCGEPCRL